MEVTFKSSPNYTKGRDGNSINKIVLHWIVGTLEAADATFLNDDSKVSAHYGIGGTRIHQYVKEEDTAWHAGNWVVNTESIGIEHEGGPDLPISEETYLTSSKLVRILCDKYEIPMDREHIIGHREVRATQCPGTLDIDRIIEMAKSNMNECEQKIKDLEEELMDMRASRNDWKRKYGELEDKYADNMKEKNEHIEALQKTVSELNQINSSLMKDKDTLIEEKNVLETKLATSEASLKEALERNIIMEERLSKCSQTQLDLENQLSECSKKLKQKLCKYSWVEFAKAKLGGCK